MKNFGGKAFLKIAALATAGIGLSGCVYDVGLGYASDGYYGDSYYDCDPYGGFDGYYDCDNRYGFGNIGYGGGWYDNFYYPGYGFFLFDNYGRRHQMRDNHRRYWGERRHRWYRENRGRHDGNRDRDGRGRGYTDGDRGMDPIAWPERGGGRVREGDNDRRPRGDGQRRRGRGGQAGDVNAIPQPAPGAVAQPGLGDGRRGGRQRWENGPNGVIDAPQSRGNGSGRNRGNRQPAPANGGQSTAPTVERAPRNDDPRPERAQSGNFDVSNERPD